MALAALALVLVVYATGRRLLSSLHAWGVLAVMGVLNNVVPMSLIVWAQLRIDSGLASILNATTPLFTVLLAHAAGYEPLTPGRLAGVGLGLAGVCMLVGPAALGGLGADVLRRLAVLAAGLSYAYAGIWGRRLRAFSPLIAAAGMVTASALLVLPSRLTHTLLDDDARNAVRPER